MPIRTSRAAAVLAAIVLAVAVAGCSSSSTDTSGGSGTTIDAAATWTPPGPCPAPDGATQAPASPVAGSTTDYDLTSFDGTVIRFHWFPLDSASADQPAPVVLMGPGWGSPGDTDQAATGGTSIQGLHQAGYNVLTWDPRGFGKSTGTVEIDSADYEARDVQGLIGWAAEQPGVQLDGPGDPRAGHDRRLLRRGHPARHRGHRLPGRRARPAASPGTR